MEHRARVLIHWSGETYFMNSERKKNIGCYLEIAYSFGCLALWLGAIYVSKYHWIADFVGVACIGELIRKALKNLRTVMGTPPTTTKKSE